MASKERCQRCGQGRTGYRVDGRRVCRRCGWSRMFGGWPEETGSYSGIARTFWRSTATGTNADPAAVQAAMNALWNSTAAETETE